ncbi:MAG TPA: ABC transporter ATP-binding protein [Anaerolineales bacterium]|nr:ABC transporter ATP-binding protein [Anaerolineales bacterium]
MFQLIVCTKNLTRQFETVTAVEDLNLEIPPGVIFGFLGPNGAGKTTTIRLLLGLLEPTSGKVEVLGFDTLTQGDEIRTRTGALLEHAGLYERMTAEDNLEFYARIWHIPRVERKARIQDLLTHLGLWERRKEQVVKWSRGMKQKLALLFTPIFGIQVLPAEWQAQIVKTLFRADMNGILLAVGGGLTLLDLGLFAACLARFQRARLVLD